MGRRAVGEIEPRANGTFRVRMRVNGRKQPLGTFPTAAEAEAAVQLFAAKAAEHRIAAGHTLLTWGELWLDARELDGVHRSVARDRHAWKRVRAASFAQLPLQSIGPNDVRAWMGAQLRTPSKRTGKTPARQTMANALNLLRVCLEAACEAGHIENNPARDVRVPRVARTTETWTYLKIDEISRLLSAADEVVPAEQRDAYTVAIYTGMRAGELFGLEWADVDLRAGIARVRYSWGATPTKRGEVRTVHLFGPAADALRRQHGRSGKRRHVFPARDGGPRTKDQMPNLGAALRAVGIRRPVRFHDLRHSCASHLVSGSWGRAWTLEETARHLGHSTSATTRRYAHLSPEGLARAVRETERHFAAAKVAPAVAPRGPIGPTGADCGHTSNYLKSAEEKGFEPLVGCPTPVFKTEHGANDHEYLREKGHASDSGVAPLWRTGLTA